jgi:riboflavin kinase/FMN adenylyltransferase
MAGAFVCTLPLIVPRESRPPYRPSTIPRHNRGFVPPALPRRNVPNGRCGSIQSSTFENCTASMAIRPLTADSHDSAFQGGAISIGNFDGVHRGHATLFARLRAMADRFGGPAVAVTFDPSPAAILRPDVAPVPLTTITRRSTLIRQCGIDQVFVCKTDRGLLSQSPEQFFSQLVVERLAARGMVEGPNFFFGRNRAGDTRLLDQLCRGRGIALEIVSPHADATGLVSSTRIRELLSQGDVDQANQLLTQPYRIEGNVIRGAARGREIGFPTANLGDVITLVPGAGVYACRAYLASGEVVPAATHIGANPTFDEHVTKVEVHLIDYTGDLYGQSLEVEFISRVRGVMRFDSAPDLVAKLKDDVAAIGQLLAH